MADAKFFRIEAPKAELLENFGADHGSLVPNYQMIPIGGERTWSVRVNSGIAHIASADVKIAAIATDGNSDSVRALTFDKAGEFKFTIRSGEEKKSGRTVVVLEDEKGKRLDRIFVSVKEISKPVNYNIVLLTDAVTPSSDVFSAEQAAAVLDRTGVYYLNVANTKLKRNRIVNLSIKRNLNNKDNFLDLTEFFDNKEKIIFDTIMSEGLGIGVEVVYVFTKNLAAGAFSTIPIEGRCEKATFRTGPSIVYISSATGNIRTNQNFTAMHETGHHFGLSHFGQPIDFLMRETISGIERGGRMKQDDIDRVNPSGT